MIAYSPFVAVAVVLAMATGSTSALAQGAATGVQLVRDVVIDGNKENASVFNGGHVNQQLDVAVTLRQDRQVWVFDRHARRIATIGRSGQGPGEFMVPQVQGWFGDTVWIYDAALRRHSYFTREGRLVRTTPLETTGREVKVANIGGGARLVSFLPWSRRSDGVLIGSALLVSEAPSGPPERETVVGALHANGTATRIASMEPDKRWEPTLALTNTAASSPNGRIVVGATVSDLTPSGSEIRLVWLDEMGVTRATARLPYRGVPYPEKRRTDVLRRGIGPDRNQSVAASRVPPVLAPVSNMLVRDDGLVLLALQKGVDVLEGVLLNTSGTVVARFELPRNAELFAQRDSFLWLKERNSDDVTNVVRYRLACGVRTCAF